MDAVHVRVQRGASSAGAGASYWISCSQSLLVPAATSSPPSPSKKKKKKKKERKRKRKRARAGGRSLDEVLAQADAFRRKLREATLERGCDPTPTEARVMSELEALFSPAGGGRRRPGGL